MFLPRSLNKHSNKSSGFSLVEIMVAMGLLAAISYGVVSLMSNMQKGQVATETKMESIELRRLIMSTLLDKNACTQTFSGISIGGNVSAIKNSAGNAMYSVDSIYGNDAIKIVSMTTVDRGVFNGPNTIRSVDLVVKLQKMKKLSSGTISDAVIRVNVKAAGPSSPITDCFNDIDQVAKTSCDSMGGSWTGTECNLPSCGPNEVLQKMNTDKTAVCRPLTCPVGSYLRGLDGSGNVMCETASVYQ